MISIDSWRFCWRPVLTLVWKKPCNSDATYIIQIIFAYQHPVPTKDLRTHPRSYNHGNNQMILFKMEKSLGNSSNFY